jgi:CheY-like chemotaxis protein
MPPVSVLVVDDDVAFRRTASELLRGLGYDVVAQAADGDEALAACARTRPAAGLVDVNLPGADGFALARELGACVPPPRVLLTSTDAFAATPGAIATRGRPASCPRPTSPSPTSRATSDRPRANPTTAVQGAPSKRGGERGIPLRRRAAASRM